VSRKGTAPEDLGLAVSIPAEFDAGITSLPGNPHVWIELFEPRFQRTNVGVASRADIASEHPDLYRFDA
jgi:hypothetical protein